MSNLNKVILAGNVGTDPEYRAFETGSMKTTFNIGVGRWSKRDEKEVTDWITVETFSRLGEYIKKGMKVVVGGSLVTSVFQTEDGKNIKRVYVLANQIELMQQKKNAGENAEAEAKPEAEAETQTQTEDLGCNADYPEDENTDMSDLSAELEDEIPF